MLFKNRKSESREICSVCKNTELDGTFCEHCCASYMCKWDAELLCGRGGIYAGLFFGQMCLGLGWDGLIFIGLPILWVGWMDRAANQRVYVWSRSVEAGRE